MRESKKETKRREQDGLSSLASLSDERAYQLLVKDQKPREEVMKLYGCSIEQFEQLYKRLAK